METYLRDPLAESLVESDLPEAAELFAALGTDAGPVAVRGLTGSAAALLTARLQRAAGKTALCLVPHGERFDEWRDDLEYFAGPAGFLALPEPDNQPYDPSSPHPGITAQRLETLSSLATAEDGSASRIVLTTVRGLLQRVPKPERLAEAVLRIRVGGTLPPDTALAHLVRLGYERFPEVESIGHFARRGGILDIYPVGLADPIRLEFDGNTVVSLRRFDAATQRSLEQLENSVVLPRHEVLLNAETLAAVDTDGEGPTGFQEGLERFVDRYDPARGSLLDYLPRDVMVIAEDPGALRLRGEELDEEIAREYQAQQEHYPGLSPPASLFLPASALTEALGRRGWHWMGPIGEADAPRLREAFVDCRPAEPMQRSMERLKAHLAELAANGIRAVILCDNTGQRDRLAELIGDATEATLAVGLIAAGFTLPRAGLAFLTDHEIFSRYRRRRRRLRRPAGSRSPSSRRSRSATTSCTKIMASACIAA